MGNSFLRRAARRALAIPAAFLARARGRHNTRVGETSDTSGEQSAARPPATGFGRHFVGRRKLRNSIVAGVVGVVLLYTLVNVRAELRRREHVRLKAELSAEIKRKRNEGKSHRQAIAEIVVEEMKTQRHKKTLYHRLIGY